MTQQPIPVQLGCETPATWDDIEKRQLEHGEHASPWLLDKRRPALAHHDVDWAARGLEPRWVGFDTADCAAALAPSIYHGEGADEFDRFREGAASRGETALVISPIGTGPRDPMRRSLFPDSASVDLGRVQSRIDGQRLGLGARVRIASDADDTDRQLALRLLSINPAPRWFSLELSGVTLSQPGGQTWEYPAQGELVSIIEPELGEPVVAAWLSPDGVERRYIMPEETPWPTLLSWLVEQALPEFVPGAMRRARRDLASDPSSITSRERDARVALAALETEYRTRVRRRHLPDHGHP